MDRAIFLTDLHIPLTHWPTLNAVLAYMEDEKWGKGDYVILGGDFLDFDSISKYSDGNPVRMGKTILSYYEAGNSVLDRLMDAAPKAEFHYLAGNHEARLTKLLDRLPYLTGLIEVQSGLNLEERGIKWHDEGKVLKICGVGFTHGFYANKNTAAKTAETMGMDMFVGHKHSIESYTSSSLNQQNRNFAASVGCLCKLDMDYLDHRPTNWSHGYGVFHFNDKSYGFFQVRAKNGHFTAPNGKEY